ncbi:MAG: hypothetical protein J1E34_07320, partial [Oscillospiraceae bacterium]|nr:hypothetical protein [Oscillospiraceae bacterium]
CNIPYEIFSELKKYQTLMLRKPFKENETAEFSYDIHKYFSSILKGEYEPLEKKKNSLIIKPKNVYSDFFEYAKETVWYGRRRGASVYGKSEISQII